MYLYIYIYLCTYIYIYICLKSKVLVEPEFAMYNKLNLYESEVPICIFWASPTFRS